MRLHWVMLFLPHWVAAGENVLQGDIGTSELKHIISFGDSYTTSRYDYTKQPPSPSCPLGNPSCMIGSPWATHGGHNWITSLTSVHNRSLTLTYNYAVYGDFLDITINGGNIGKTSVIQNQYPRFLNNTRSGSIGEEVLRSLNTLLSVWVGINDVAIKFEQLNEASERQVFATNFLRKYFDFLENLSKTHRVRNFLLLNIPSMERSPSALRQSSESRVKRKALTDTINREFPNYIRNFRSYLARARLGESVNVFFYDTNRAFTRILDHPGDYGFTSATDWGSTNRTFWGDSYHPGAYGHAILANEVGKLLEDRGFWGTSGQFYNEKL